MSDKTRKEDRPFSEDVRQFLTRLDWKGIMVHAAFYALLLAGATLMYFSVRDATAYPIMGLMAIVFSEGLLAAWKEAEERPISSERQITVAKIMKWIHVAISGIFIGVNFIKEMTAQIYDGSATEQIYGLNVVLGIMFGVIAALNMVAYLVWRANDPAVSDRRETTRLLAQADHETRRLQARESVLIQRKKNAEHENELRNKYREYYDFDGDKKQPRREMVMAQDTRREEMDGHPNASEPRNTPRQDRQ